MQSNELGSTKKPASFPLFFKKPFQAIDSFHLNLKGFDLNFINSDIDLCDKLKWIVVFSGVAWFLMGWDSSLTQIEYFFENIPQYLLGNISWDRLVLYYTNDYGKGMHWSAVVIYGLEFIFLSRFFRKEHGETNSRNLAITGGLVALTIATFEFCWMGCFYHFQNQHWVLEFRFGQLKILLQNIMFLVYGAVLLVGINWRKVKPNLNVHTLFLFVLAVVCWEFWVGYGAYLPVKALSVEVQGLGTWTNSRLFPQTVYTVDTNLLDGVAAGEQFWVQDNMIHLVNLVCKVFQTGFFLSLFSLKKREIKENL